MLFERIAVIGTGLIGGSVALGLRAASPGTEIVGYDIDATTLERALNRDAISALAPDAKAAVDGAELVVLASPVETVPTICESLAGAIGPTTVVTDVGSAKAAVVEAGESAFGAQFVGGHPMAGSERHGIDAADAELFVDAMWVLTPTSATSSHAYRVAAELAGALGASVVGVDPGLHDEVVAALSHVPQLAASALVDLAAGTAREAGLLHLAGGGFRDATRIAASNAHLWAGIIATNRSAVLNALEALSERLTGSIDLIRRERWDELAGWLDRARTARLELFQKPAYTGEPVTLAMLIPDRPGILAEVTTAAGRLGANIEDLRILHSTEGGRGRLEVVVAGETPAQALCAELDRLGYRVEIVAG